MTISRLLVVLLLAASLSACGLFGGSKEKDCNEGVRFQNREVGKRVVVPEGLDPLDQYEEMQIPPADPDAAPPAAGKCADSPPQLSVD